MRHRRIRRTFRLLVLLILIFILTGGIFALFQWKFSTKTQAAWFDDAWGYRQVVVISNGSGATQTEYQVQITVDTATLVTAGKVVSDCRDIRVTDAGGNLLKYWIEPGTCNGASTLIWTKVNNIPSTGGYIYLYYGNPAALSQSSAANTFIRDISHLKGAWKMDETSWTQNCTATDITDSSGNSHHGKSCPSTTGPTTTSSGKFSYAGSFDSTNDYADLTNSTDFDAGTTDSFTAEFWMNVADDNSTSTVLSKGTAPGWRFRTRSTDNTIFFQVRASGNNGQADSSDAIQQVTNGSWHHIVGVRDVASDTVKIYVDGVQHDSQTDATTTTITNTSSLTAGLSSDPVNGTIDEVRYYNKALTAGEITDLANNYGYATTNYANHILVRKRAATEPSAGTPASEEKSPGPVAYWKFDEGTGTTTTDSSINKLVGTLSGTTVPAWKTEDLCISGKCLYYDGATSRMVVNDPGTGSALDFTAGDSITLSAWVNPNTLPGASAWTTVLTKGATDGTADTNYAFQYGNNDGNSKIVFCFNDSIGSWNCWESTSAPVEVNKWQQIAITFTYGTESFTAYHNGISQPGTVTSGVMDRTPLSTNKALWIGADQYTGASPVELVNGKIDDVKIYRYIRTTAQLKADYDVGKSRQSTTKGTSSVLGGVNLNIVGPVSDGLVGYWKMDESDWTNNCSATSVTDSSGNGNNGVSCPSTTGPDPAGAKFGNGGSFDGNEDYISIADPGANSVLDFSSSYTLSAWIYLTSDPTGWVSILAKGTWNYALDLDGANGNKVGGGFNGGVGSNTYSNTSLSTNRWYHVVAVFDDQSNSMKTFVDGQLDNYNTDETASPSPNNSILEIGSYNAGAEELFPGKIDEVRLYNRVLSPAEVSQLYNWAPGPIAYYPMDENTGTTSIYDHSGNTHTGTMNGTMTESDWISGKFGSALDFDGSDDRISVSSSSIFNAMSNMTVSMWANTNNGSPASDKALFGLTFSSTDRAYLYLDNTSSGITVDNDINNSNLKYGSNFVPTSNEWFYVTWVIDGTDWKIYINGVQKSKNSTSLTIADLDDGFNISIGDRSTSGTDPWIRLIDDVKIYSYARTPKQIVEDMNAGHPAGGSPVGSQFAYIKFDEGYGRTAYDSGPNKYNANLGVGVTNPSWNLSGKFGKAIAFNGGATNANLGNIGIGSTAASFTISSWVSLTTNNAVHDIVSKKGASGNFGYRLYTDANGKLNMEVSQNGTATTTVTGLTTLSNNTWYHVVGIYKPSTSLSVYLNSLMDGNNATSIPAVYFASTANIEIGSENSGASNLMNGLIDETKIYSYDLTESEIKADYNRGSSTVLGSLSNNSSFQVQASSQQYCIPGDTSTCRPPVGEWKFEEKGGQSANDSSGQSNTGTLGTSGSPDSADPLWTKGKIGTALKFDSVDDTVTAGSNAVLDNLTQKTVTLWLKRDDISISNPIVTKWEQSGEGWGFEVRNNGGSNGPNTIRYNHYWSGSAGGSALWYGSTLLTDTSKFYHVAVSYDSSSSSNAPRIFVNGIENTVTTAQAASGTEGNDSTDILRIGADSWASPPGFTADEVKIFNYLLTPAQIAWDYNRGLPSAHWKLDECQGTVANDYSGNGNTGTITITSGGGGSQDSAGTCTTNAATAWYNGRNGKYNSSLNFDGTNDYVNISDMSILDGASYFSLSAWVNPSALGNWDSIITKYSTTTNNISLQLNASDDACGNDDFNIAVMNGGTAQGCTTGNIVSVGNWYHVVAVYDGTQSTNAGKLKLFVNGIQKTLDFAAYTVPSTTGSNAATVKVGFETDATSYWNGQIDDVKIFNYPLTAAQVKTEFNQGAAIRFGPATGTP